MPSTPLDIGQPTREARTGREDRGQRGKKWWTLVAVCLGTFMLLLDSSNLQVNSMRWRAAPTGICAAHCASKRSSNKIN
jgi:hypothetical protein